MVKLKPYYNLTEGYMNGFAVYETKVGYFRMEYLSEHITFFKKTHEDNITDFGTKTELTEKAYKQLQEYFDGNRKQFDLPYRLNGTEFQKKVWNELTHIPYGETISYKDIAIAVGNEKASRAIGMANNKNPITVIIPCHRVIGTSGKLVGYAGGLTMKEFLLDMERKNR